MHFGLRVGLEGQGYCIWLLLVESFRLNPILAQLEALGAKLVHLVSRLFRGCRYTLNQTIDHYHLSSNALLLPLLAQKSNGVTDTVTHSYRYRYFYRYSTY